MVIVGKIVILVMDMVVGAVMVNGGAVMTQVIQYAVPIQETLNGVVMMQLHCVILTLEPVVQTIVLGVVGIVRVIIAVSVMISIVTLVGI